MAPRRTDPVSRCKSPRSGPELDKAPIGSIHTSRSAAEQRFDKRQKAGVRKIFARRLRVAGNWVFFHTLSDMREGERVDMEIHLGDSFVALRLLGVCSMALVLAGCATTSSQDTHVNLLQCENLESSAERIECRSELTEKYDLERLRNNQWKGALA
ncbi:MAG: hypothetical protein R3C04_12025, partial [Hyphomonas sp.]